MDRIDPKKTLSFDDRTWIITRTGPEEQFEIECILLRVLGPAAAVGVGIVVDALAKEVALFLAETTGSGADFDLANLGDLDTSDGRIARAWARLLEVLPDVAGSLLGEAFPVLLARLEPKDLHRLMQLAVFNKTLVQTGRGEIRITDYKVLGAVLVGSSPATKWRLLAESLRFNYADEISFARPVAATSKPVDPPTAVPPSEAASG
jgi:hypothetical protein